VEVYEVLFKKLPIAAASMTAGGQSSLLSRGASLLTRASGLLSESVGLWKIYADFMEKHARADVSTMLEIRLNAYRNGQKQGWASSESAFPVVVGNPIACCIFVLLNLPLVLSVAHPNFGRRALAPARQCILIGGKVSPC
jgi:hypothetical protein